MRQRLIMANFFKEAKKIIVVDIWLNSLNIHQKLDGKAEEEYDILLTKLETTVFL